VLRVVFVLCLLLTACTSGDGDRSRTATVPPPPLTDLEPLVLEELNALRANPAAYAAHIEPRLRWYDNTVLRLPEQRSVRTFEGKAAAEEAIAALKAAKPLPVLQPAYGLTLAARDHARDIGPKGLITHDGSGGTTTLSQRVARYARHYNNIGENISFGPDRPRDITIDLLIDDNVRGREHRQILLDRSFHYVGIACGPHAVYRTMCVMDFAGEYEDSAN
jgi:hypothetical protein